VFSVGVIQGRDRGVESIPEVDSMPRGIPPPRLSPVALALVALALPASAAELAFEEALASKPVVAVILGTEGRLDELAGALSLDGTRADALARIAAEEQVWEADLRWRDPAPARWNAEVAARAETTDRALRDLLGGSFPLFAATMDGWFHEDAGRSGLLVDEECLTYEVYGTQYAAYTSDEVAIPDKYVKFANLGWGNEPGYPDSNYEVRLQRNNHDLTVWVGDVGPWNIDDNYWNDLSQPRPRRMWTDLPQGKPEAEAAYYDGYNGGMDEYGRSVTNPAGIDMAVDVAADMGLAYLANDWITVTWTWECWEVELDEDGDGYTPDEGDCDDGDPAVHPGGVEQPNHVDDDCDGIVDEGTDYHDDDGDGYSEADGDCHDGDPTVHPGAPETPDHVDEDCDGDVDEGTDYFDDDGDGYTEADGDCMDDHVWVYPGATELGDHLDNDCDGQIDEGLDVTDDDGDGYSEADGDCDDHDPGLNPGATEVADNHRDDDCDGVIDETGYIADPGDVPDAGDDDDRPRPPPDPEPYACSCGVAGGPWSGGAALAAGLSLVLLTLRRGRRRP